MTENESLSAMPEKDNDLNRKRKFHLILLTILLFIISLIWGVYWTVVARYYETTDDAYVNGNIIPITSQVAGTIVAIKADDTQFVKAGQLLVELDFIDSAIAYEQAEANLAQTLRSTQQLFINDRGLNAGVIDREVSLNKARNDVARRNEAIGLGAISKEDQMHAQDSLKSASAALTQAQSALSANRVLIANFTLQHHPDVLVAAAQLRRAWIDYKRNKINAPIAGEIAKRSAQIGQHIAPGTQLMALVPLNQIWVNANFKEKQLLNMRIGQTVTLTADMYGPSVEYRGEIIGFSAGTGSAFALLPPQNATGNWIKVVQRLPVRIALDPAELKAHPLRIGLSMDVTVNTHDRHGSYVSTFPVHADSTMIYEDLGKQADIEVADRIAKNIEKMTEPATRSRP